MAQEALPFGTPSEPGDDPLADAIERALAQAGLGDGGSTQTQQVVGDEHDAPSSDAAVADAPDGD